jgi:hypothetical protein
VIGPLKEVSAGLNLHALSELAREGVSLVEGRDLTAQECLRGVGQRPVKGLSRRIRHRAQAFVVLPIPVARLSAEVKKELTTAPQELALV